VTTTRGRSSSSSFRPLSAAASRCAPHSLSRRRPSSQPAVAPAQHQRSKITSLIAGLIFGLAWWLFIDAMAWGGAYCNSNPCAGKAKTQEVAGYAWLPGAGMSIGFVMLNWWPFELLDLGTDEMTRSEYNNPNMAEWVHRSILLVTIVVKFLCLTGAIVIMVVGYLTADSADVPEGTYPGVMVFVSNLLIFLSAFIMRAGTIVNCNGGQHEAGWA
jgi:hypothetical protein